MKAKSFYRKSLDIFHKMFEDSPTSIYYETDEKGLYFTNTDGVICRFIPNKEIDPFVAGYMNTPLEGKLAKCFDTKFSQKEEVSASFVVNGYLEFSKKKLTRLTSRSGVETFVQTEFIKVFPDNSVFFVKDRTSPVIVAVLERDKNMFYPLGVICPILFRQNFIPYEMGYNQLKEV